MFGYIRGKIVSKELSYVISDVNGVGFKIYSSVNSISALKINEEATLYTYLYIKEGIMDLYGFATEEELSMFEMLISVSGVGAKGAIAILSIGSPSKIAVALVTNDVKTIKSAQGIGPKIAQRIILELKDKIKNEDLTLQSEESEQVIDTDLKQEAVKALMVLGYSKNEAQRAVSKADSSITDLEELIKAALKAVL